MPVGDYAVAAALPVGDWGAPQQLVLAGVQRHQQVDHEAGVVDGLAEHGALLVLHQLLLLLLAQGRPRPQLLRGQVHGRPLGRAGGRLRFRLLRGVNVGRSKIKNIVFKRLNSPYWTYGTVKTKGGWFSHLEPGSDSLFIF